MIKQTLNRQELYDLVWSTPMTTLARKYAISDVGLRKICIKMEIPLPKVGYWMRVKCKNAPPKSKLKHKYNGETDITLLLRKEADLLTTGMPSSLSILKQEIIAKEGEGLNVPEILEKPHPLVKQAKQSFEKNHRSHYFNTNLYGTPIYNLNIAVARENIGRALRFMDTLIKLMIKRGHEVNVDHAKSYFLVMSERIEFRLSEKLRREPATNKNSWNKYQFFPTGSFIFNADGLFHQMICNEGKFSLEKQMPTIVARLELLGEKLKQDSMAREIRRRQEEQAKRIREEKQKRIDKERTDFKILLKTVNRWHVAENIRNYIKKVEENAKRNNAFSDDLKKWIDWACKKADWYDPLISSADEYLIESDLDKLSL